MPQTIHSPRSKAIQGHGTLSKTGVNESQGTIRLVTLTEAYQKLMYDVQVGFNA